MTEQAVELIRLAKELSVTVQRETERRLPPFMKEPNLPAGIAFLSPSELIQKHREVLRIPEEYISSESPINVEIVGETVPFDEEPGINGGRDLHAWYLVRLMKLSIPSGRKRWVLFWGPGHTHLSTQEEEYSSDSPDEQPFMSGFSSQPLSKEVCQAIEEIVDKSD